MIAYRMQDASRDINDLLDPDKQLSFPMDNDDDKVRRGVSGCVSLPALAAYIAVSGIEASYPVVVEIEGPESDDTPLDADYGEVLLLPTSARVIEPGDDWWETVGELFDMHYQSGTAGMEDFHSLRAEAEDRLGA